MTGLCSAPVPAVVSRYLVEVFDHAVAPSHGLPPVAGTLIHRAKGVRFKMTLGKSLLGVSAKGEQREVLIEVVGVSPKAIDLGATLPVDVVRRWNREYAGAKAGEQFSSVVVKVKNAGRNEPCHRHRRPPWPGAPTTPERVTSAC